MTPTIHTLPLSDIDADALPRDRISLAPSALAELQASIASLGLTHPIEVWRKRTASDAPYGLISGLRRLTATRALGHTTIPAFIRDPSDIAEAMTRMVSENEIRAAISPWEKGRLVTESVAEGLFPTLDAATDSLYRTLDRHRRARIRAMAEVVSEIGDHLLTAPETLSQNQITRIAFALRADLGPLITTALRTSKQKSPDAQWKTILPILLEAEETARTPRKSLYREGRPRRMAQVRSKLHIRRERTPDGWSLRFTGPEATGPLMEDIMDAVEDQFGSRQR
ncbi:ParB/RepB/Spo0J family partition protein [Gymnodinialimonas ceratoperidinii]|uniref:ParB N-terminal domain-containing protein n=1 Tax=Gymnodinialimonas ceratoperidinii TaxID=2856823 RepID=A0A8F6TWS5_9RHOB|nr:ParB N-terminal domain-containing protein [Gymnodinialimonas ceratoperidinii]QXT39853.1 ParB N-terminal domain-containing protein [Gymnodinialimonas ceratoperidinii]